VHQQLKSIARRSFAWPAGTLAVAFAAFTALAPAAFAAVSETYSSPALTARLITAENGIAPDAATVSAGIDLRLGEGWKTYWRSPGEVGLPPEVDWTGSENLAEAELLWPAPERFTAFGIENFGYKNDVVFPLRVRLREAGAAARLTAKVSLLVCSAICVPENFVLTLDLPAATGIDPASAARIADYAARVPDDGSASGITVTSAHLAADRSALTVTARSTRGFSTPDIFPELGPLTTFGRPDIRLGDGDRLMWAELPILGSDGDLPALAVTITDGGRAATIAPALSEAAAAPPFVLDRIVPGVSEVAWVALIAFVGGLILNAMPCVLPVLSIKLGSAMKARGQSRARLRAGFLASAAGIVAFMWVLATATVAARGLGLSVGWGLQFQNPVFLAAMIVVLALFAANLFGAFEIALPASWQTRLARADGQPGLAGDFANGAFAAVLATPCSAPFLGTAVAFALSGRPADILIVFTALGIGLSLPYLLVAAAPGLVRHLPRPGRWTLWLKAVLGGLLALTAAWLIWVLDGVAGGAAVAAVTAGAAAVVLLLALRRLRPAIRLGAAVALTAATLASPVILPEAPDAATGPQTAWTRFERGEIARLVSTGKVVVVDVTADWCLTCKANKALVLDRDPVRTALAQPDVVAMQADWTRPDEAIARYLESFGRFGIPFNAVYGPAAPGGIVLPELLSSAAVLEAIGRARGAGATALGG
jgi:suppressor for copper-sensitivity B